MDRNRRQFFRKSSRRLIPRAFKPGIQAADTESTAKIIHRKLSLSESDAKSARIRTYDL